MRNTTKEYRWLEYCTKCKKNHYYHIGLCPTCQHYEIPVTISENACPFDYQDICDGCEAYKDHLSWR